jgi:hypothetical protein
MVRLYIYVQSAISLHVYEFIADFDQSTANKMTALKKVPMGQNPVKTGAMLDTQFFDDGTLVHLENRERGDYAPAAGGNYTYQHRTVIKL